MYCKMHYLYQFNANVENVTGITFPQIRQTMPTFYMALYAMFIEILGKWEH